MSAWSTPPPSRPSQNVPSIRPDLILIPTSSFVFGFVSGLLTGSRLSGRQFLAENAHRLPTTVQGWYFYQKTKNYRVLFGGIKGGFKTGARLGGWTAAFVGLEEGIEWGVRRCVSRGSEELKTRWLSGIMAGVTISGAAGWWYRLSRYSAPKRYLLGATLGAVAGGSHDLRDWMKARLPIE